jgi:hypothetical protein
MIEFAIMKPWDSPRALFSLLCGLFFVASLPCSQAGNPSLPHYETGLANINRLAADLCRALKPEYRRTIQAMPVIEESTRVPTIRPVEISGGPQVMQGVSITSGFVDLVNYVGHAKAIDASSRGFFKSYMERLASASATKPLPFPADHSKADAWTLDTMNLQVSHFNQMVGALIAIDLSHHYLGHYKKYRGQLRDAQDRPLPINAIITQAEWRAAVLHGARNALDCGLGVDGLRALFEGINKMPVRPPWTLYFLPDNANVAKINRELQKLEKDFFLADY